MGLNKSTGNMYSFITHTWNTVKGECYHDCSYCYMKRWGKLNPARFDEKELKTDLGTGNFIFIGSSCDMFAKDIPAEWIQKTIDHCLEQDPSYDNYKNRYMFQTKNPGRILDFLLLKQTVICTTIESDIDYPEIKRNSPDVFSRSLAMNELSQIFDTYVTIEPIMDFNLDVMVQLIRDCNPKQVNIGANTTSTIKLLEPPKEKILALIDELQKFTVIHNKSNLNRILNPKVKK